MVFQRWLDMSPDFKSLHSGTSLGHTDPLRIMGLFSKGGVCFQADWISLRFSMSPPVEQQIDVHPVIASSIKKALFPYP